MEVFGIKFAPINVPVERRLQTLAAAAWVITLVFGGFICCVFALYLTVFTSIWSGVLLYVAWSYLIDKDTCENGGRRSEWARNWLWWKYFRDYFPAKLERVPWVQLDPKRNYLFCAFPHGMLSTGPFCAFVNNYSGFKEIFPNHTPHLCVLTYHFLAPFYRELALGLGAIAASEKSLNYTLSKKDGGNVAVLLVGGAEEAFYCRPGCYKLVLNKRKGFVRVALKNGSPLVPVISFGETDLYSQVENPEGSRVRRLQEWLKQYIGIAPAIPLGRGFFQYNYGIVPHRKPVTTLVGRPIDVKKTDNPTREEINELHEKFKLELNNLFEEQKHLYLQNAEEIQLEIM